MAALILGVCHGRFTYATVVLMLSRPNDSEYAGFYANYIARVPDTPLLNFLAKQPGDFRQLLGAAFLGAADIEMVAHQVQERVLPDEITGAQNGMAVAERLGLRDETEAAGMIARYPRVNCFVAG